MRGISEEEFANTLKDCMLSVWIDKTSSFGTFPLESMKSNVPVLGVLPKMVPSWLNEENGIWIQEEIKLVDFVAEFIQNWLEDNISEKLYQNGLDTSSEFSDFQKFEKNVIELFSDYFSKRTQGFQEEINKLQLIEQ